jgi:hypothetical protein
MRTVSEQMIRALVMRQDLQPLAAEEELLRLLGCRVNALTGPWVLRSFRLP